MHADPGIVEINCSQCSSARILHGANIIAELDAAVQKGNYPMRHRLVELANTAQAQYKLVNTSRHGFYTALTWFNTTGLSHVAGLTQPAATPTNQAETRTAHKVWNVAKSLLVPRRFRVNQRSFDFSDPSQSQGARERLKDVEDKAQQYNKAVESLQKSFNKIDRVIGKATSQYTGNRSEIAQYIGSQYFGQNRHLARQMDEDMMQIRYIDEHFCGVGVFSNTIVRESRNAVTMVESMAPLLDRWIQGCKSGQGCQDMPDEMRKLINSMTG